MKKSVVWGISVVVLFFVGCVEKTQKYKNLLSRADSLNQVVLAQNEEMEQMFADINDITLVKETSIVSFVGAVDLFTAFSFIGGENYEFMIPYLMMALIYIFIVVLLTVLIKVLERRLRASDKR